MTRTTSFSTTLNPASVVEDASSTGTEQAKQGARAAGQSETAAPAAIAKLSQIGGGSEGGRFRIRALESEPAPAPAHAEVTDKEVKDLSMALDARADRVEKSAMEFIKRATRANPNIAGLLRGIVSQQPHMEAVISDLLQESAPYLRAIAAF